MVRPGICRTMISPVDDIHCSLAIPEEVSLSAKRRNLSRTKVMYDRVSPEPQSSKVAHGKNFATYAQRSEVLK